MRQHSRSSQPSTVLLFTAKFRDRLTKAIQDSDSALRDHLLRAPTVRRKYVRVDLADSAVREALSRSVQPWVSLAKGTPPALVGSARRIASLIGAYEEKMAASSLNENR